MSERVLALDPGDKVGWAAALVHDDGSWTQVKHGITPLRDMAITLGKRIVSYNVIVCEDWRLYPIMAKTMIGSSFPSVQFIGMVRYLVWTNPGVRLVTQGAAIKTTADKTMKSLRPELFAQVTTPRAHDDAHDMDALRHLWYWTWTTRVGVPNQEEAA